MKVTIEFNKDSLKWEVFFVGKEIGKFDTLDEATHEYEFAEVITPNPIEELVIS